MKKGLKTFYTVSYIVLTALTLLMIIGTIAATAKGDASVLTGGLAAVVFAVFAILQVICLAIYKPGISLYKIGFYLLHAGLLVMLVGFLAYAVAGEQLNVEVPVNSSGSFYTSVQNEEGETTDLGFGMRISKFTLEKYEDTGNDKYYRADLTYIDPTTLAQDDSFLEVNNTDRRNGWKIYLMSYNDGASTLRNLYGIGEEQYYDIYSADGAQSGTDLVSLVQQDLGGHYLTYYLYDATDGRFYAIDEESLALRTGTLYAHTFAEGNQVSVYINDSLAEFDLTFEANGDDILSYVADNYADRTVHYYYYTADQGVVTMIDEDYVREQLTQPMQVEVKVTDAAVSLYIMMNKQTPDRTFTADGGSALMANLADVYGKGVNLTYQLYDRQTGAYLQTTQTEVMSQTGNLRGYALAMGDNDLLVYVHPVSVHLLLKKDPGELAVYVGIGLLFAGVILTCLIRGRKKNNEERVEAQKDERLAQANRSGKASNKKGGRR